METSHQTTSSIIKNSWSNSIPYLQYRALVESHVHNNSNTGSEVTQDLAAYTALNHQRMRRLDKTLKLSPDAQEFLKGFNKHVAFVTITESWCGDAAQTLPMVEKLSQAAGIEHRLVLRDENEALMNLFLTNGNKSIAKVIMIDPATYEPIADWGPRPSLAAAIVAQEKEDKGVLTAQFKQELQGWYNKDKGKNTLEDFIALLKEI
ncbi:MAG: thioredoxin family protein [Nonlabens sp.]